MTSWSKFVASNCNLLKVLTSEDEVQPLAEKLGTQVLLGRYALTSEAEKEQLQAWTRERSAREDQAFLN